MNDELFDSAPDAYITENVGDTGETETILSEPPDTEPLSGSDNSGDTVSDTVGTDTVLSSDTETVTESNENSENTGTENDLQNTASDTESTLEATAEVNTDISAETGIDYTPELEYIDYLLNEQLVTMRSTVSGNCINVSLDDNSLQAVSELSSNQLLIHEELKTVSVLLSCIVFCLCADFLFMSAKRVVKNITNRKD